MISWLGTLDTSYLQPGTVSWLHRLGESKNQADIIQLRWWDGTGAEEIDKIQQVSKLNIPFNNEIFKMTITITGLTKFLHDTITNRCSIMGERETTTWRSPAIFPLTDISHEMKSLALLKDRSLKSNWLRPGIASSDFCFVQIWASPHAWGKKRNTDTS